MAGGALGIAVATKFSTLVFLPPAIAAIVVVHYWDLRGEWVSTAAGHPFGSCLQSSAARARSSSGRRTGSTWSVVSTCPSKFALYGAMPTTGWPALIRDWRVPGHEFIHGQLYLKAHTVAGHRATLFDQFSQRGFLIYYPVILATKTPIPLLLFSAAGLAGLMVHRKDERWRWFAGFALGALRLGRIDDQPD